MLKYLHKFKYLREEYSPHGVLIKNSLISVDFLENWTGEITAIAYFCQSLKLTVVVNRVGVELSSLLTTTFQECYWETSVSMCLISHSKDENGNISAAGTASLLKFEYLSLLESYITMQWLFTFKLNSLE